MNDSSPTFESLMHARLSRRSLLAGAVGAAVASACVAAPSPQVGIPASKEDRIALRAGLRHDVIIRWGDGMMDGVADLTSDDIASGALFAEGGASLAARRFGVSCDGAHFFPHDANGTRGILCVNNEYPTEELMFAGWPRAAGLLGGRKRFIERHPEAARVAMASVGVSVVEIERTSDGWQPIKDSRYNRKYTANTAMRMSGPAAGSEWLKRASDPTGFSARGTMGNCASGKTPWGTYLTAEENVPEYFGYYSSDEMAKSDELAERAHGRFPLWPRAGRCAWEVVDERFDSRKHPREALAFGWIVEIDPQGQKPAVKRTALGRFYHESATCALSRDSRPVVYSGDDRRFEYLYKFIGRQRYDAADSTSHDTLLDEGVLHVARFNDDGTGEWIPLVYNEEGVLNRKAGFRDQADVIMQTRRAADLLGATPMDRPEDIAVDESRGLAYVACTKNPERGAGDRPGAVASNPRESNRWGHIIELHEGDSDLGALAFQWEVFLLAGDPLNGTYLQSITRDPVAADACYFAGYPDADQLTGIGAPDNLALDPAGNLWIVTDGEQPGQVNNGCFVAKTRGPHRGHLARVMSAPVGAEVCACAFDDSFRTLFLSIQHPGEGGRVESPVSHWPDSGDSQPRPSVIAVEREDGGSLAV